MRSRIGSVKGDGLEEAGLDDAGLEKVGLTRWPPLTPPSDLVYSVLGALFRPVSGSDQHHKF
jgi:hypothetical protein